jgi:hypothetical protein
MRCPSRVPGIPLWRIAPGQSWWGRPVASRPSPLLRAVPGDPVSKFVSKLASSPPSRVPPAHPSGERAGAGTAMAYGLNGDVITLAVPVMV